MNKLTTPRTVNSHFLFEDEITYVKDVIFSNKDKWFNIENTGLIRSGSHTNGVNPSEHFAHFFGPSLYSMSSPGYLPKYRQLAREYNIVLNEKFERFYARLKINIETQLGVECVFKDNTSLPGFHIFGSGVDGKVVEYNYFYTHNDSFPAIGLDMGGSGEVYSFIIPIQVPKSGAKLEYFINSKLQSYDYSLGELSCWSGTLPHRIGYFNLDGADDYRITWQLHVAVQNNKGYIFW